MSKPQIPVNKEETFKTISNALVVVKLLSEVNRDIFLKSLKKNPIRNIFENGCFKSSQIYNYEAFKDFFIYLPDEKDEELYFIRKDDVDKVTKNLKVSLKNDWKMDKKHLMN